MAQAGLSPRVRGNRGSPAGDGVLGGSIPACAGEPRRPARQPGCPGVYPRVCGGTGPGKSPTLPTLGLSPRVRGEPPAASVARCPLRVYPRVCGGTPGTAALPRRWRGLSPRVRGNPQASTAVTGNIGSIPACAGEPLPPLLPGQQHAVYPRVCGGTGGRRFGLASHQGLSPRVRGNLRGMRGGRQAGGSIPACAGEPRRRRSAPPRPGVYPRVCGGTEVGDEAAPFVWGLSPRVRGNPGWRIDASPTDRSIPACAGEPRQSAAVSRQAGVYPRVCGGTSSRVRTKVWEKGLSPRVRGNLCRHP